MYKIIGGDGKEYGPVDVEQIRKWIQDGRAGVQTQVQSEGQTDWKALGEVPELAALLPATPPPPPARPGFPAMATPQEKIPNYLVQAILCTLCCCLPAGIAAIVYAAQVNSKQGTGDYEGALAASKNAKLWCWISFGVGLPLTIIILVINILTTLSQTGNH